MRKTKFGYIKEKFFQLRKWKEETNNAINAKKNKTQKNAKR